MSTEMVPFADFAKDVLPFELSSRAKNKAIQVVSDFDETQCSTFVFSSRWNTHAPKIRTDLSNEAKRLARPMCLATARAACEPVSWVMWHKLSGLPMPLVAENGAVLVWPSRKIDQPGDIEIVATQEQIECIKHVQAELEIRGLEMPVGHELILRPGRVATVEMRAQEVNSKKGTPGDYVSLAEQLQTMFPEVLSQIDIVSSGNSLGIQPKGVNKETGISAAFTRCAIPAQDVFLVGIGDNKNDAPLFNFVKKNGGLTIGVRTSAKDLCDFVFNGGDRLSLEILQVINAIKGELS